MSELLDPILGPHLKGFPHTHAPVRRSEIGGLGWNVLAGDLPLPIALLRREALEHNIAWMQQQARGWGIGLAPHGKTTMSPQLFRRQLDAGAWGITFATVTQLCVGVAAGVRRALIANQVVGDADLSGLQALLAAHADLRAVFLVDSTAQLDLIERWCATHPGGPPFEVMLEIGLAGGRTGCRTQAEAITLAARVHASTAVKLVGIECYEGLGLEGASAPDQALVDGLMDRVETLARECAARDWFETGEVLISAGGSGAFDLVARRLVPALGRPVRGLLRSGCYVTHDHGTYQRFVKVVDARLGCAPGEGLRAAMEVWALVQSRPEPGLAILAVGKRDVSHDMDLPVPINHTARGALVPTTAPAGWRITGLNDQHAYLRWDKADEAAEAAAPAVGDRIGLGISHPCTTFDKWQWMPIVENDYRISDAVSLHF
jgi:D-serine dehydratase